MFITYHRVGRIALLPALAVAGVVVVIGGIAAVIAVATLAVFGVVALSITVLRAFVFGGRKRRLAFEADKTIEGVVVTRSSSDGEPSPTSLRGPALRAADRR
jgi:hypothetical protein